MVEGGGGDFTCGTNLLLNLRDQDVHTHTQKKTAWGNMCIKRESREKIYNNKKNPIINIKGTGTAYYFFFLPKS